MSNSLRSLFPLHAAARSGDVDRVKTLLQHGRYSVDCKDTKMQTPLHYACANGHIPVVRLLLLQFKADTSIQDTEGTTAIMIAARQGFDSMVHKMLSVDEYQCSINTEDIKHYTVLHYACEGGHLGLVRNLIKKHKANVNARKYYNTIAPVQVAAECGKGDVALALINEFHCDTDIKGLLESACIGGSVRLVLTLVRAHNFHPTNGLLHLAQQKGHVELAHALIKCDPTILHDNSSLINLLLQSAYESENARLIKTIISKYEVDINYKDQHERTALHQAARYGKEEVVTHLVDKYGLDVNARDRDGNSVLHLACMSSNAGLVRTLILKYKGADMTARDDKGNTPFHTAVCLKNEAMVFPLIEMGCDIHIRGQDGGSLLHTACRKGYQIGLIRTLIKTYGLNIYDRDDNNNMPIHVAVLNGNKETVVAFIEEFGCDPYVRGHLGRSLLHLVADAGRTFPPRTLKDSVGKSQSADENPGSSLTSRNIVEVVSKYISPFVVDDNGDTPLHIACLMSYNRHTVEELLRVDPPLLLRNNHGKTPRDLAASDCKDILDKYAKNNSKKIYKFYNDIQKKARKKYSTAERITRIFVIGNPGTGKSSLVETLKREGFLESFKQVSESSVPPHTAGIVPSIHTSKHYGRVLFYDFAGDPEYYSSHAAILENIASSRKGDNIFIIVVDLREDWLKTMKILNYWLMFVQHQNFSKREFPLILKREFPLILVGSHSDALSQDLVQQRNKEMKKFCENAELGEGISQKVLHFILDCRKPRSNEIGNIQTLIVSHTENSPRHKLSLHASILLGLLEKDFGNEPAFPVADLKSHIEATGISLPTDSESLRSTLEELHDIGLLFLLGKSKDHLHVVFNISKLTNEVHRLLFSPSSETNTSSFNIGIIPQSLLREILHENITTECLVQLQYCQEISHRDVGTFPSFTQSNSTHKSFLFFPALCSVNKSDVSWITPPDLSYNIGWLARCINPRDYFPPRFLHVLLLKLVFRFTLSSPPLNTVSESTAPDHSHYQRRCTMWKTGVYWLMEEGVECMVELVNGNKGVVVLTKSEDDAAEICASIFNRIISCVMEVKTQFCHSIRPQSFLLDSTHEADYLNEDHLFAMSEVETALTSSQRKQFVVSVSGEGLLKTAKILCLRKLTLWYSLFPMDYISVLHLLEGVVRGLYKLGIFLDIPQGILEAIEEDFPTDTSRRRRELVRRWLSSSLEPPCWWRLVQALRSIKESVLAQDITREHGIAIQLQEKLLAPQYRDLKPDEEFLEPFASIVGANWRSLAAMLSLSVDEEREEGLSQQDHTLHVLQEWSLSEDATYSCLRDKLQTISLFQFN